MTVLLEMKQKIKNFYGRFDTFILPVFKFILALVYFLWINQNMGYMEQLNSMFVILILALICCILPGSVTVYAGWLLMIGHCYALGMEIAAFFVVLLLFMLLLFLRFCQGKNIVLAFAPLSFAFNMPVLLPIGCGLLGSAVSALPAGCGIILYYFVRLLKAQSASLMSADMVPLDKVTLLADGMMNNWAMWINVIAVILVILLVYLIRTRSFDYAWRIAIVTGGIAYICVMLIGGVYLSVQINLVPLILYTVIAVLLGLVLEFFVFGGDYTRIERLEYEDDEYYYYVKAVPKSSISTSERSIKKINGESPRDDRRKEEKKKEEKALTYANPIFRGGKSEKKTDEEPVLRNKELDGVDFEKKLEESLKDL
jgi:hypothetical protein